MQSIMYVSLSGASVSLVEPTSFSVTEGDNSAVVPFCVQLDDVAGGLERDIPLSISVGGSAGTLEATHIRT